MSLNQFFTPFWLAEALVERHFGYLSSADFVLEPSCGRGAFLAALPATVPALGIEIDPAVAAIARAESGRDVRIGDFRTIELDVRPTAVIGNPPFGATVIDAFLRRSHAMLPQGGRLGFLLPVRALRSVERVMGLLDCWSLHVEMLPCSAFASRMREPLFFSLFTKDRRRALIGLALFAEDADKQRLAAPYRRLLAGAKGSAWRAVCKLALERLGGEADLQDIYRELERGRPTETTWWREKIRQTLRVYADFTALRTGRYALRPA